MSWRILRPLRSSNSHRKDYYSLTFHIVYMAKSLGDVIQNHMHFAENKNHNIEDSSFIDKVSFRHVVGENRGLLMSVYFEEKVDEELSRYGKQNNTSSVLLMDFFGFNTEFKYVFRELKSSTVLSKESISQILTDCKIKDTCKRSKFDLYFLCSEIID